jgi:hypothetical protein
MLTKKPTRKQTAEWKEIYRRYKDRLTADCKSAEEIFDYINSKYTVEDYKISGGYRLYSVKRDGKSESLYADRKKIFKKCEKIIFYFSDYPVKNLCNVEGSDILWDEAFAFRGLDEEDIGNYFLVAEYIDCLKRCDKENPILLGM